MAGAEQEEEDPEKQVNIKVRKSTKDEWRAAVDENPGEYQTLTQLIIKSVNRELSGEHEPPELPPDIAGLDQSEVDLDPVIERLDGLETQMSALTNEFRDLEIATGSTDDVEKLELMASVQDLLPLVESEEEFMAALEQELSVALPHAERSRVTGEVEDIHLALTNEDWDVSPAEVRNACSSLAHGDNLVNATLIDGERHFYELKESNGGGRA